MRYIKSVIFSVIFATITLQACTTRTIKIDPIPELKSGSPLSGIEPLTFKINEFEDVRPYKKQVGVGPQSIKIELEEQKVSDIVAQAIANELKRNGHKTLQPKESGKADVVINGIVRQYWVEDYTKIFTVKVSGHVEVEINVVRRQDLDKPLSKTFRGKYYYSDKGVLGVWEHVINQALLQMIKEFTTDEEFLNVLKKVKRPGR